MSGGWVCIYGPCLSSSWGMGGVDAEVMDAEAGVLPAGLSALVASEDLGSIFPYFTRRMEA